MASNAGSGRGVGKPSQSGPPRDFPSVPPPTLSGTEDRFALQPVGLKEAVAELSAKTDRLVKGVESQSSKLDGVRQQIAFVKGAVWVIGALVMLLIAAVGLCLRFPSSGAHAP